MYWIRYTIVLCLAIGLYWSSSYFSNWVAPVMSYVAAPFVYLQYIGTRMWHATVTTFQDQQDIYYELLRYRDMYERVRSDNIRLQAELSYANAVDEVAEFAKRYNTHYGVTAAVIFRQCTPYGHTCLIDAGYHRGIQQDMIVVYKNVLVGRVEQVYPWYSRVRLVTDSTCYVPVSCIATNAYGIHYGGNRSDETYIGYVNHLSHIQPGDTIVTRAHGVIYPYGFGVGRIRSYTTNDLYHHVVVEPYVDIQNIAYCTVIQPGSEHCERAS